MFNLRQGSSNRTLTAEANTYRDYQTSGGTKGLVAQREHPGDNKQELLPNCMTAVSPHTDYSSLRKA